MPTWPGAGDPAAPFRPAALESSLISAEDRAPQAFFRKLSGVRVQRPSVVPGPAAGPLSQALKDVLNLARRLDIGTLPGVTKQALEPVGQSPVLLGGRAVDRLRGDIPIHPTLLAGCHERGTPENQPFPLLWHGRTPHMRRLPPEGVERPFHRQPAFTGTLLGCSLVS